MTAFRARVSQKRGAGLPFEIPLTLYQYCLAHALTMANEWTTDSGSRIPSKLYLSQLPGPRPPTPDLHAPGLTSPNHILMA